MSGRYISSSLIKNIHKGSKLVVAKLIEKTTAWAHSSEFPSTIVREDFTQVVYDNIYTLMHDTSKVAMMHVN